MRRLCTTALVVCAALLTTVGAASASSHGGMPPNLGILGMVQWELEHFMLHIEMTYQAIQTMFVSPSLGWQMLGDQSQCADTGELTKHLFDTALHALMAFLDFILTAVWVLAALVARIRSCLAAFMRSPLYRLAGL